MKKGILITIIGIVIIGITYFGIEIFDFAKGVEKYAQKNGFELEQKPIIKLTEFKNGRWISTSDSLAGIEIENEKWIIFYKGMETDSSDIYKYKTSQGTSNFADSQPNTGEFLTLTNSSDTLNYEILRYDVEFLNLMYLPRGNILIYKPEK
jgi:hypothetical protein